MKIIETHKTTNVQKTQIDNEPLSIKLELREKLNWVMQTTGYETSKIIHDWEICDNKDEKKDIIE